MGHFYNEFDPVAAEWLRELIKAGLIPDGEVDERDIRQVQATDLRGYGRCHFFTGICGWGEALRLAGWPADIHTFTGSPPCQSFSTAGKRKGQSDERHLWPEYFRLIRECRPVLAFGEQVEGAVKFGWLDGVRADLEGEGYAFWPVVLGAHSGGAPHIRQRIFFAAVRNDFLAGWITRGVGLADASGAGLSAQRARRIRSGSVGETGLHGSGGDFGMADTGRAVRGAGVAEGDRVPRRDGLHERAEGAVEVAPHRGVLAPRAVFVADAKGAGLHEQCGEDRCEAGPRGQKYPSQPAHGGGTGRVDDADGRGQQTGGSGGSEGVGRTGVAGEGYRQTVASAGCDDGPCSYRMADGEIVGRGEGRGNEQERARPAVNGVDGRLADADGRQSGDGRVQPGGEHGQFAADGGGGDGVGHTDGRGRGEGDTVPGLAATGPGLSGAGNQSRVVGVAHDAGLEWDEPALRQGGDRVVPPQPSGGFGFWSACDLIRCRDTDRHGNHRWRRIPAGSAQSVLFGLASRVFGGVGGSRTPSGGHGEISFPLAFEKIEGRAAVLKGVGNAIVPQVAAEFVAAVMEVLGIEPEFV